MITLLLFTFITLSSSQSNKCLLGRDAGDNSCGKSGGQKFYFDSRTHRCQPFLYKGCNGNENRFDSRDACFSSCSNATSSSSSSSDGHGGSKLVLCPAGNVAANDRAGVLSCDKCPEGYSCTNGKCCSTPETTCNLNYDAGRFPLVGSHIPMYFYSKEVNNCMLFTYYGSEGNPNNFQDYNACRKFCAKN